MKTRLLTFILSTALFSFISAQVVAEQVDTFDSGTNNWAIGGAGGSAGPTNVANGGPNGAGDNCLQYISTGTNGVASRMIIKNSIQWANSSDYTGQQVLAIKLDAKVDAGSDLNLRVAFNGDGGKISTTNSYTVTSGSGWNTLIIPIEASDFTTVEGGSNIASTLASVFEMRILSSAAPAWKGDVIASTLQLDNIVAANSNTLSVNQFTSFKEFSIYPNPGKSRLNINLPSNNETVKLDVFDVLGKKIYSQNLNSLRTSISISDWNTGLYLVRVTTNNKETFTKRFMKQ
ncbi:T9SS type A sorting domain-containing protein [Lacinutrix salivirga]